jgi:CBS domain-containing membrane protein
MLVRDIMRSDPVKVKRDDTLAMADRVMQLTRVRYLPVTDEDGHRLVGILGRRDLLEATLGALRCRPRSEVAEIDALRVRDAMTGCVLTTTPQTPLAQAARRMHELHVGALPVVEDSKLVGILSESDFVALASRFTEDEDDRVV